MSTSSSYNFSVSQFLQCLLNYNFQFLNNFSTISEKNDFVIAASWVHELRKKHFSWNHDRYLYLTKLLTIYLRNALADPQTNYSLISQSYTLLLCFKTLLTESIFVQKQRTNPISVNTYPKHFIKFKLKRPNKNQTRGKNKFSFTIR